jgi:hypothetical protein
LFEPHNSPFTPNVQKEIVSRDIKHQPYQKPEYPTQHHQSHPANKPIVDLQVYQPPKPRPQSLKDRDSINPVMYMPIPAQTPYFPPQFNSMWPYYSPQLVNPVIKQYSINNGPFVNYSTVSVVKEDALPKQFVNTSNTLGERVNINSFVRSVFIKYNDGEDIDLDGKGNNSLLSYLKFMELNPYNTTQHPENPYIGLPDDMLIYRSCYPIRYDDRTNSLQCAPNSIGMNIRIYKLSNAEYNIKKLDKNNFYEFDLWREIAYYEYIREQILKRKICPNFVMLHAYYISERCNVDFDKIKQMKGTINKQPANIVQKTLQAASNQNQNIQPNITQIIKNTLNKNSNDTTFATYMDKNSGKGLIALTEAPTYNIYGWSTKTYRVEGNIQRMVNTGYHKSEVWMSVLFQLMSALYVLQLHKIAFNKFTIEDNVYIKDISLHENIITYWKYKVRNFEYYVPNYGYLLLLDTNYKDLINGHHTLLKSMNNDKFKVYSNIFKDSVYKDEDINNMCFDAFKTAINPNSFTNAFTNYGGTKPPEIILSLLQKIYNDATSNNASTDISYYIIKWMGNLLNNRTGTYLSESEIKNVRKDDTSPFIEGQIIVQEVQNQTFKFVIFVKQENDLVTILTKEDHKSEDIISKNVRRDSLFNYSKYDTIVQNYKPMEANLNEDELLETYVISK